METNLNKDLKNDISTPLQHNKTNEVKISDIIKPIAKVVNVPGVSNNKQITNSDLSSSDTLVELITKPLPPNIMPDVINGNSLSDEDRRRLFKEEEKRRKLADTRDTDIQQAYDDEMERRVIFDNDIITQRLEFQNYINVKYPEFHKNTNITSQDEIKRKNEISINKNADILKRKVERLEKERIRKSEESKLKLNTLTKNEVVTFLEDDIILEQKVKQFNNPELEGLSEVDMMRRDIELFEQQVERTFVPHRDVVESDESDFDDNRYTDSGDIILKIPDNK